MAIFALPDYPTAFWVMAAFVMLLTGLGKSGFGSGFGALATPLLALTIPVADAAALLLPLLIIMDMFTVPYYWRRFDRYHMRVLLLGALVGIAVGAYYFDALSHNERAMKMGIGALAVLFVLIQVGRTLILGALSQHRPPATVGWLMGAVGGFTSTVAHAGGPPVTIYLVPQGLPRDKFVGTTAILFAIINLVKLVPYSYLGLLRVSNVTTVLLLAPLAYVGVRLGVFLNQRFTDKWFTRFVYAFLLMTGMELLTGWNLVELFLILF
ncbi:MAG: sulfite exporter TauE/SafE family protein [Caldilineaceae bacterium]